MKFWSRNNLEWLDWLTAQDVYNKGCLCTSHSAYIATSTESNGAKIDGLLNPNFFYACSICYVKYFLTSFKSFCTEGKRFWIHSKSFPRVNTFWMYPKTFALCAKSFAMGKNFWPRSNNLPCAKYFFKSTTGKAQFDLITSLTYVDLLLMPSGAMRDFYICYKLQDSTP